MSVYETDKIRNVALLGHQGSGKTMVAEAMLLHGGAITRVGTIEEGSTVSDYHPSENQRQMSVFASLLHPEWEGHKINVLDTPGYPDFVGEVASSIRVVDTAIYVLNAVDGVQVGTDLTWGYGEKAQIPALFLINHIDKEGVDFDGLVESVQERFGRAATVVQLPAGPRSVVDLLLMKQLSFPEGAAAAEVGEIDAALRDRAEELHNTLVEDIAENDEALMEQYLEQGELGTEEMMRGLKNAIVTRQMFPILLSSAPSTIGISRLMSFINECCPSPAEAPPTPVREGEPVAADPSGPPVAFVFRTMSEQHVGEYSFFRVCSGTIEQSVDLENAQTGNTERLGSLFVLNGRGRDSVPKLSAGDIGATVKLKSTRTNDTLHPKDSEVIIEPIEFPEVRYTAAVRPLQAGEEDKLSGGMQKLCAEDPSLRVIHNTDLNQVLLGGLGEMQLEIAKSHLKERFGVEVELSIPKVSYRETVQGAGRASYRHKKQTGGAGQFADISLIVEQLDGEYQPPPEIKVRGTSTVDTDWGAKVEFIDAIVSGVIDMRRFSGAIQKGVVQAMRSGPIAGYPVGDVRIIIYDGKMHSVDSNETAFRVAARMGFREAFQGASPVMLEPIFDLEVRMPDAYTGEVMSDLNTRRARIQGMEAEGALQKIVARAPEAELLRYSTTLRSLTQGRGLHTARFSRYEPMPRNIQDKIVEEAMRRKEEAE